jgi:hypothetical protein
VPAYFNPPAAARLPEALRDHLESLLARFAADADSRLIFAAGLMTFGRLDMAEAVIQELPARPVVLDHGAGWCRMLPYRVAAVLLPLPERLRDPSEWVEGSPQAEALRSWFSRSRDRLQWDPVAERFTGTGL